MRPLSDHAKGLLITVIGVLVITPDGLLNRLISADAWTLLFWRGLLSAIGLLLILLVFYRSRTVEVFRVVGLSGLYVAVLFGVGTVFFILAITNTSVANTLFIVSTAPLFSALMARHYLNEAVGTRTWLAIVASLAGIAIIASSDIAAGTLLGNGSALASAVCMAGSLTLIRRYHKRNMVPAFALSGLVTMLLVLPFASPLTVSTTDFAWLSLMGLVMLPISFGLLFIGPRYIPAPEVSLMLLLEAVLGPLWVWLAIGEEPGARTLVGGAVVIGALALNALLALPNRPGTTKSKLYQSPKNSA